MDPPQVHDSTSATASNIGKESRTSKDASNLLPTPPVSLPTKRTAPTQLSLKIGKGLENRVDNAVYTTKYNIFTYLPISFREQFRRNGNVYFLVMGFLMYLGTYTSLFISSITPWSTLLPLFIFMSISVIQEGMADLRRNRSDRETNNYPCVVLRRSEDLVADCDRERSIMGGKDIEVQLLMQLPPSPGSRSYPRKQDTEALIAHIAFAKTKRKDIRAGDVVLVRNREMIPVDLVLLGSSGESGTAYIETSSIDGETNLKLRSSPQLPAGSVDSSIRKDVAKVENYEHPKRESLSKAINRVTRFSLLGYPDGVSALLNPPNQRVAGNGVDITDTTCKKRSSMTRMTSMLMRRPQPEIPDEITENSKFVTALTSEAPNASVNTFLGKITLPPVYQGMEGVTIPLDAQNMLLRGAVLRNTEWVIGVACFTGSDTKLVQNSIKTRSKFSNLDLLVNRTVIIILILMFVIVMLLSCFSSVEEGKYFGSMWYVGYNRNQTNSWPYLTALDYPAWDMKPKYFHQHVLGYITLLNNFVPLSLYVTVEIATLFMMLLISWDKNMYQKETNTFAAARSTVVTDLGQVKYVFSDKTGTLTQNVMRFKRCSVDGMMFGAPVLKTSPFNPDKEKEEEENELSFTNQQFHPLKRLLVGFLSVNQERRHDDFTVDVGFGSNGDGTLKANKKNLHEPLTLNAEFFLRVMSICHTVVVEKEMDSEFSAEKDKNVSVGSTFGFWKKSKPNAEDSINQLPVSEERTESFNEDLRKSDTTNDSNDAKSADGSPIGSAYQAESPDEGALVSAASQFGFQLKSRGSGVVTISCEYPSLLSNPILSDGIKTRRISLKKLASYTASPQVNVGSPTNTLLKTVFGGKSSSGNLKFKKAGEETWNVLAINKFDSDRKRMSLVVRSPPELGSIPMLLCKGADSSMLDPNVCGGGDHLVKDGDEGNVTMSVSATVSDFAESLCGDDKNNNGNDGSQWEASNLLGVQAHLGAFASEGLRTLVLGVRILSEYECLEWLDKYEKAGSSIVGRDGALKALAVEIEKNLHIVGATAIEDKLQDGVPETISKIGDAGIKLWVLTGDKRETAIEIGYSTKVLNPKMHVADIADGPVGNVKALVAMEFMRLVKMGKLSQYQLSALEEKKLSFCANVFKKILVFFGAVSKAYILFYHKYVRTLCGTCNKVQSEMTIRRIEQNVLVENITLQRKTVRNLAQKIIKDYLQSIELVEEKSRCNIMKRMSADSEHSGNNIPGIFSRAKNARLLSIRRQSTKSELRNIFLGSITSETIPKLDHGVPSVIDEDVLSLQSFVSGSNREFKSIFNKKKRTLLEKLFAIDRDVRKGLLVKHLTKEKKEEFYSSFHMLHQNATNEVTNGMDINQQRSLVIEGSALLHFLCDSTHEELLFAVASSCDAVIACRVSPKQKALLVKMVQNFVKPTPVTLAIGDGANDVGMIQEAHVGVGISGLEGQQAVNASDFSIAQFRFLEDLLFIHGRWNFYRLSKVVLFSFYKNALLAGLLIAYTPYAFYSGTPLFDQWVLSAFNFVCTWPILFLGMFDRDLEKDYAKNNPNLYAAGLNNEPLCLRVTFRWVALFFLHVIVIFFAADPILGSLGGGITSAFKGLMHNADYPGDGEGGNIKLYGTVIFMILNWTLALKVLLESGSIIHGVWPAFTCRKNVREGFWNRVAYTWHGVIFLSIGFNFFFVYIYQLIGRSGPSSNSITLTMAEFVMLTHHMLNTRSITWLVIFIVTILAIVVDVVLKVYSNMFYPTQTQIHREIQLKPA